MTVSGFAFAALITSPNVLYGLPGDVIQVRDGDLIINGAAVDTSPRHLITRAAFERESEQGRQLSERANLAIRCAGQVMNSCFK